MVMMLESPDERTISTNCLGHLATNGVTVFFIMFVYFLKQRIDMVPELLSSNLCSLRGGEERSAA